jgi:hypothetical protein
MDPHEIETHLRGASDAIMVLLGELEQLEGHKRGVLPADPRFGELATAVRQAAQSLADLAREEEDWGRSATLSDPRVGAIAQSPNLKPLSAILARWREVERQLDAAEPGSDEATKLFAEFQMVREEYLAAFRGRSDEGKP